MKSYRHYIKKITIFQAYKRCLARENEHPLPLSHHPRSTAFISFKYLAREKCIKFSPQREISVLWLLELVMNLRSVSYYGAFVNIRGKLSYPKVLNKRDFLVLALTV